MKPLLKLTFRATIALAAVSAVVSCKDEPDTSNTNTEDQADVTPAPVFATVEGTIGETSVSISLDTDHSSISIEEWDGIPDESEERSTQELSLEAFLLGTALWSGPPRLITITHHIDDISLDLRFAGRLAVDEKLTALPGCVLKPKNHSLVPVADGSWESATDVTLPSYDLRFIVTSYDETNETVSGTVNGQFIDPTKPDAEPISVNLAITSQKIPEVTEVTDDTADSPTDEKPVPEVEDTGREFTESTGNEPAETDAESPETNTAQAGPEESETANAETVEAEPGTGEDTATPAVSEPADEPEVRVAKPVDEENDQEEEDVEVRRAVPVPPKDRIGF